jgi:cysteine-rich repeat protein
LYVPNNNRRLFLDHLRGAFDGVQQLTAETKKHRAWKQLTQSSIEMIALHTTTANGVDAWPMRDTMEKVAYALGIGNTGISSKVSYWNGIVNVVTSGMTYLGTTPTLLELVNTNDNGVSQQQQSVQDRQGMHGLLVSVFMDFFLRGTLRSPSISSTTSLGNEVGQITEYIGLAVQTAVTSLEHILTGRSTASMSTTPTTIQEYIERIAAGAVAGSFNISSTSHVVSSVQFLTLSQVVSKSLVTGVSELTVEAAAVTGAVDLSQLVASSVKTCVQQQQERVLSVCSGISNCPTRSSLLLSSAQGVMESLSNIPTSTLAASEVKTMIGAVTKAQVHGLSLVTSLVDSNSSKDAMIGLLRELLAQIMSLLSLLVTSTTNANVDATLLSTEIVEELSSGFSHGIGAYLCSGFSTSQIQTVISNSATSTVAGIAAMRVAGGFNGDSAMLDAGQLNSAIQSCSKAWVANLPTMIQSSSTTQVDTVQTLMTSFTSGSMDGIIALSPAQQGSNAELKQVIGAVSRGTIDGAGQMLANDATTYYDLNAMISSTKQAIQPLMTRTTELGTARSSIGGGSGGGGGGDSSWVTADSAELIRQVTNGVITSVSDMPSCSRLSTAAQVKTVLSKIPLPAVTACYGTFSVEGRSAIVGFAVKSFVQDVETVQASSALVSASADLTGLTSSAVSAACTSLPLINMNTIELQDAVSQVYGSALEGAEGSTIDDLVKTSTDLGSGFASVLGLLDVAAAAVGGGSGLDNQARMTLLKAAQEGLSSGISKATISLSTASDVNTLYQATINALGTNLVSSNLISMDDTMASIQSQTQDDVTTFQTNRPSIASDIDVEAAGNDGLLNVVMETDPTRAAEFVTSLGLCSVAAVCGDSIVGCGEQCDDGNSVETDGCSSTCLTISTTDCASSCVAANSLLQNTSPLCFSSSGQCVCKNGYRGPTCNGEPFGFSESAPATSCLDILKANPNAVDGAWWIQPTDSVATFLTWCDMTTDGGGWTL